MTMSIRFWGVRGSVAAPGPHTVEVGGNTSCVEVVAGDTRLILDAGTGLRGLGNELLASSRVNVHLLLSHFHWDHIQGLPFFAPIFKQGTRVEILASAEGSSVRDTLRRQMSAPTFPVDLNELPSQLSYRALRDRQVLCLGDARVTVARLNHPGSVMAYRIEYDEHSVVYATDTEHYACPDPKLLQLANNADILIYDSQYTPDEYSGKVGFSRVGWGHSTYEVGSLIARSAGVGQLVLFHHDPSRTDEGVRQIELQARQLFPNCRAAREGMVLAADGSSMVCAA